MDFEELMSAILSRKSLRRKLIRMGLAKPCTPEEHRQILQKIHDANAAKAGMPPMRERTKEQQRDWRRICNLRYFARVLGCDLSQFPPYIRKKKKS